VSSGKGGERGGTRTRSGSGDESGPRRPTVTGGREATTRHIPPKLVFCANQAHALLVRDLINQVKTSTDPNYCHRVTADDGELGEQHLRDFQDNEKTIPTVLTTSQKLSTGMDARNIRNIVLLRPINSTRRN